MQSHLSSVVWPFSLQCSLQYLPCSPPFSTIQLQAGCAHLFELAMVNLPAAHFTPGFDPWGKFS